MASAAFAQPSYKEAKALLQKSSTTMKAYQNLRITFSYTFENTRVEPPVTQKQTGDIAIKGNNYHLKLESLEQIRSGNKLYNILNEDEEVQVTNYDPEEDEGLTPSKILDLFKDGYSYKLGGSEVVGGKKIKYVILKPNANPEIDKIMIGIEASTNHVYSMKQWGSNGTTTTLTVSNFTPNASLPSGYFSFNKADYPGYYIAQ
jgi:outer membrane lipoprotein-sorting protein